MLKSISFGVKVQGFFSLFLRVKLKGPHGPDYWLWTIGTQIWGELWPNPLFSFIIRVKTSPGGIIHVKFSYWCVFFALDRSLEFPVEEWREDAEEELEALIWLAQREINGVIRKQTPRIWALALSLTVVSKVVLFPGCYSSDILKRSCHLYSHH